MAAPFNSLPPLVRKQYAHGAVLHDPKLHAPEKALMFWFCDHANDDFVAWPGIRRLGRLAGIDHRNCCRHLRKLELAGYIETVSSGSRRGDAARYRLTFKGAETVYSWKLAGRRQDSGVVPRDDTAVVSQNDSHPVVPGDDRVSFSMTQGVVLGDARVSFSVTTESPIEPANKAGERGGDFGTAPQGAALVAARETFFQQFKAEYPKRVGMADARSEFDRLLDGGVPAQRLIDQARALRLLVEAGQMEVKHAKQPAVWLRTRTWADDDYTVFERAAVKASKASKASNATKVTHEPTAGKVTASGAQPVEAVGEVEGAKQTQPPVAAGVSIDDEWDRQSRRYAPVGFDLVRAKLESVNLEQQFGNTLRDALLAALKYKPELAWCEGGLDMNADEVRKEADKALEQALSGEWGDELGYDDEGDWMTSVQWFCSEDRCRVMVDAIDQYAADCRTGEA
jgi:hypothetical protein